MIPVKGEEQGAFVLTSKKDGQKYVMSEKTLNEITERLGSKEAVEALFKVEWVELTEEERKLAEEIRQKYFAQYHAD